MVVVGLLVGDDWCLEELCCGFDCCDVLWWVVCDLNYVG